MFQGSATDPQRLLVRLSSRLIELERELLRSITSTTALCLSISVSVFETFSVLKTLNTARSANHAAQFRFCNCSMIRSACDIRLGATMKNANGAVRTLLLFAFGISILAPARGLAQDTERGDDSGAVFAMTNGVDKNEIIAFRRNDDGTLQETRRFETDGRGSGGNVDPLGSQGSLVLSGDHSHLFAVNAGSGELSVFRVEGDLLSLEDRVVSGGSEPVAVTQHGDLVYVVNAGGNGNVVGFRWQNNRLSEIPNSTSFLSGSNSAPGSIAFSPDGKFVAVSEKQTSKPCRRVQRPGRRYIVARGRDSERRSR